MVMEGKEKGCAVVQRSAKKGEKEDEYEKGKREGKERNAPSGIRGMQFHTGGCSNNCNNSAEKNIMHTHSLALTCLQSPTDLREELLHALPALG